MVMTSPQLRWDEVKNIVGAEPISRKARFETMCLIEILERRKVDHMCSIYSFTKLQTLSKMQKIVR